MSLFVGVLPCQAATFLSNSLVSTSRANEDQYTSPNSRLALYILAKTPTSQFLIRRCSRAVAMSVNISCHKRATSVPCCMPDAHVECLLVGR